MNRKTLHFQVLKITFNVGSLKGSTHNQLTTFILEGVVSGVMVGLMVLCYEMPFVLKILFVIYKRYHYVYKTYCSLYKTS